MRPEPTSARRRRRLALAHRLLTTVSAIVLATVVLAAATGIASGRTAIAVGVGAEVGIALAMVVLGAMRFAPVIRQARRERRSVGAALVDEEPVLALLRLEVRSYAALWRAVRRRPRIPGGCRGFGYLRGTLTIPLALVAVAVVEMVLVHLLVPWPAVRIAVLALEIWGILLIAGILAGRAINPHVLGREDLVLRWGYDDVVRVPLGEVSAVRMLRDPTRTEPRIEPGAVTLAFFEAVNVEVDLARSIPAKLATGWRGHAETQPVRRAYLYLSDPQAFVEALSGAVADHAIMANKQVEGVSP